MTMGILALIGMAPILFQSDEILDRGQRYLEGLGADLESRIPLEQPCGIFMGRKWVGELRMNVRKAPEGSGAVLEWSIDGEVHLMNMDLRIKSRILFDKGFTLHSGEILNEGSESAVRKTLSVAGGRWTRRTEKDGKVEETTGELKPGSTVHPELLMILGSYPKGELGMRDLASQPPERRLAPDADPVSLMVGGRSIECHAVRIHEEKKEPDLLYFDEKGRAVELRPVDNPIRIRPVASSQVGKDLNEPLRLADSERALIDLFRAIKRNERENALSMFDLERLAEEMIPGFGSLKEEDKKKAVESLRENLSENLVSEKTRKSLPEEGILEDILSEVFESNEKGDLAEVRFQGQVWHLYRAAEGDRKGRWLIYKIMEK